jgi:hypothetical protein
MGPSMELSPDLTPWTTDTLWLRSFVSSAENVTPDYTTTMSISHPEPNGVVTIGNRAWDDYRVSSTITFHHQQQAGLVIRARGHRRYYAGVLVEGAARIIKRKDNQLVSLAQVELTHAIDDVHHLELSANRSALSLSVDGSTMVTAEDDDFASGGAGFLVDTGGILADGFTVNSLRQEQR